MCHKTCRGHRSHLSLAGVKFSFPLSALSALECDQHNKLPWSAVACEPVYEGMRCAGHVFPGADPCSSCGQLTRGPSACNRAAPLLAWASTGWGARSTVAHKRISPPHKDSGPLLSLTRSTKEVTFVCLECVCVCVSEPSSLGKEEEEVALVGLQ